MAQKQGNTFLGSAQKRVLLTLAAAPAPLTASQVARLSGRKRAPSNARAPLHALALKGLAARTLAREHPDPRQRRWLWEITPAGAEAAGAL